MSSSHAELGYNGKIRSCSSWRLLSWILHEGLLNPVAHLGRGECCHSSGREHTAHSVGSQLLCMGSKQGLLRAPFCLGQEV